jgi:hypothetical protein
MPWLQGRDRKRFFNQISAQIVLGVGLSGGVLGLLGLGPLGGVFGFGLGVVPAGTWAERGRFYRL